MVKIVKGENCGNSPKAKFIQDFLVAVADMDIDKAMGMLEDDVHLEIVGKSSFAGREKVKELFLKDGNRSGVQKLKIENILSHGKKCAANGTMQCEDDGKVAFNNIYTFSSHGKNARINEIKTYSIILNKL